MKHEYPEFDMDKVPSDHHARAATTIIQTTLDGLATTLMKVNVVARAMGADMRQVSDAIVENITAGATSIVMAEMTNCSARKPGRFSAEDYASYVASVVEKIRPTLEDVERAMEEVAREKSEPEKRDDNDGETNV